MEVVCKDCGGTGKLGFQREDCWFCGGKGYTNVLEGKDIKMDFVTIKPFKDIKDISYNGDLDKYFQEVKECDTTTNITRILSDMYDLIKSKECIK